MDGTRKCPYCGEEVRVEATRCRWCRSRLTTLDPERWHRDHPDRRLAGVAAAVARALTLPVGAVRVAFVVLTFVHFLGPLVYAALWLLSPYRPGEDALFTQALASARDMIDRLCGRGDGGACDRSSARAARDAPGAPPPGTPVEPRA